MKASGVDESLLEEIGRVLTWPATPEQIERAMTLVPDDVVQLITASGTPDECRAKVQEYLDSCCRTSALTVGGLTWCVDGGEPVRRPVYGARVDDEGTCNVLLRVPIMEGSSRRFEALREKVQALAREVAERRQTEEELLRYRLRLQSVLDNSTACIYLKDSDGRYILINRRYEEVAGVPQSQAAGRSDDDFFPPDVAQAFRANDLAVLERGVSMEFEELLPQPDGDHTFLSLKFPVPDPVTGHEGVGGISTDITGRKRMDEQLRETQKLESLGVLAGGVAHDFNNLLTGILGNASLVQELLSAGHPAHEAIREVLDASERAAHLTRQLLAYAGKGRFVVERLDLSSAVRDISNLVRCRFRAT
jgi:PAS domain S-box-containing protein